MTSCLINMILELNKKKEYQFKNFDNPITTSKIVVVVVVVVVVLQNGPHQQHREPASFYSCRSHWDQRPFSESPDTPQCSHMPRRNAALISQISTQKEKNKRRSTLNSLYLLLKNGIALRNKTINAAYFFESGRIRATVEQHHAHFFAFHCIFACLHENGRAIRCPIVETGAHGQHDLHAAVVAICRRRQTVKQHIFYKTTRNFKYALKKT